MTPAQIAEAQKLAREWMEERWKELRAGRKPINGVGEENKWIKKL